MKKLAFTKDGYILVVEVDPGRCLALLNRYCQHHREDPTLMGHRYWGRAEVYRVPSDSDVEEYDQYDPLDLDLDDLGEAVPVEYVVMIVQDHISWEFLEEHHSREVWLGQVTRSDLTGEDGDKWR